MERQRDRFLVAVTRQGKRFSTVTWTHFSHMVKGNNKESLFSSLFSLFLIYSHITALVKNVQLF